MTTFDASRDDDRRIPHDQNGETYRSYVLDELIAAPDGGLTAKGIMERVNSIAGPGDRLYTHSQVVGYLLTLARKRRARWSPGGKWRVNETWLESVLSDIPIGRCATCGQTLDAPFCVVSCGHTDCDGPLPVLSDTRQEQ